MEQHEQAPAPNPGGTFHSLRSVTTSRVSQLQREYLANESRAVATLANLRRCDPAVVGAQPAVWSLTLANLPDTLTHLGGRRSDDPTPAERALHATLVLFAQHLQSQGEPVHVADVTFGRAVGRLARARAIEEDLDMSTVTRLQQAALATTANGRLEHLQALIKLMRAEKPAIGLDYGLLAVDLWRLFDHYQDPTRVLVRWARDLHTRPKKTETDQIEETK